jgi:hypothetical protein
MSAVPDEPNPYRHDHNPLNADFHGGICSACEWDANEVPDEPDTALRDADYLGIPDTARPVDDGSER